MSRHRTPPLSALAAVLLVLSGCGGCHQESSPIAIEPPRQEPHLQGVSGPQQEIEGALEKLASDRRTIENLVASYDVATRQVGPVFDGQEGEAETRRTELLERCSDLEATVQQLEAHPQLAEYSGAAAEIRRLHDFLSQTRAHLEQR